MNPFEVVHCYKLKRLTDLILMTQYSRVSGSAPAFALLIHELHKKISNKIQKSNPQYKSYADMHRRHLECNVSDYIMIWIRSERFYLELLRN